MLSVSFRTTHSTTATLVVVDGGGGGQRDGCIDRRKELVPNVHFFVEVVKER